MKEANSLKDFLDSKVELYNRRDFIKDDPICIPHLFSKRRILKLRHFLHQYLHGAAGRIIINKSKELMQLMEMQPHQFILHHSEKELKNLLQFKHRTFNTTDLLYFIEFLKYHYSKHNSLEDAFSKWMSAKDETIEKALIGFHHYFFSIEDVPAQNQKTYCYSRKKIQLQAA
jgi:hypothetical protein